METPRTALECNLTVQALNKDLKLTDPCPKCNFPVMDHEDQAVKAAKSVIDPAAGGYTLNNISITCHVDINDIRPTHRLIPLTVAAMVDSGCSFGFICSRATWGWISVNCADLVIVDAGTRVMLAGGYSVRHTYQCPVNLSIRLGDGSVAQATVTCFAPTSDSDIDMIGLIGLEELGIYIDPQSKCIRLARRFAGHHYAYMTPTGSPEKREGKPTSPHLIPAQGHEFRQCAGGVVCSDCGRPRTEHRRDAGTKDV